MSAQKSQLFAFRVGTPSLPAQVNDEASPEGWKPADPAATSWAPYITSSYQTEWTSSNNDHSYFTDFETDDAWDS